jgi:hypothetical protein
MRTGEPQDGSSIRVTLYVVVTTTVCGAVVTFEIFPSEELDLDPLLLPYVVLVFLVLTAVALLDTDVPFVGISSKVEFVTWYQTRPTMPPLGAERTSSQSESIKYTVTLTDTTAGLGDNMLGYLVPS